MRTFCKIVRRCDGVTANSKSSCTSNFPPPRRGWTHHLLSEPPDAKRGNPKATAITANDIPEGARAKHFQLAPGDSEIRGHLTLPAYRPDSQPLLTQSSTLDRTQKPVNLHSSSHGYKVELDRKCRARLARTSGFRHQPRRGTSLPESG